MAIFIVFAFVFCAFIATFLFAKRYQKHDYIDIMWGMGFVLSALISYFISQNKTDVGVMMTAIVVIWGLRLSIHLAKRNLKSAEDQRYQKYREDYKGKHFDLYFFFRMYVLQYVLNLLIVFPVIYVNLWGNVNWQSATTIGLIIWCVGFAFESIGDWQLAKFISRPANKGKLMTSGLWRYTRHPNYFGETTQWWGIYVMALSNLTNFWLVFSPLIITLLLLFISGVPLLEKQFEGRDDWTAYKSRTSKFFPLPPKQID